MKSLEIVVLAAGQGKRMHSNLPKVLHPIAGTPMLKRVITTAQALNPSAIHVITGHGGDTIRAALADLPVQWVHQAAQLGTGHAVLQALPFVSPDAQVLILSGDVPLIRTETLKDLVNSASISTEPLALLVARPKDPTGLGRMVRDALGNILAIVEEKDATPEQRGIREIYSGICCVSARHLHRWLPRLSCDNAQGEYYLTEILTKALAEGIPVCTQEALNPMEVEGVNSRLQLERLERAWQRHMAEQLLHNGVSLADASRLDVRGTLTCGRDVFIDVNVVFTGNNSIGEGCRIGPNCTLHNVTIGAFTEVHANSVLEDTVLGEHCAIGPFARLRPGTRLEAHCKIGNFVETKNIQMAEHSKASHLSYIGDATIGKKVNIGAGTITCNYDGVNKHQTIIGDGAFIGSDTQLVAPVTVGAHATIGAGTTLRKDAPADELTLTESRQKTVCGWKRPVKAIEAKNQ